MICTVLIVYMCRPTLSDNADTLMFISVVVFLFLAIENCKSALSHEMDNMNLCAVTQDQGFELILHQPLLT